jgi:hypothetical protein
MRTREEEIREERGRRLREEGKDKRGDERVLAKSGEGE